MIVYVIATYVLFAILATVFCIDKVAPCCGYNGLFLFRYSTPQLFSAVESCGTGCSAAKLWNDVGITIKWTCNQH